MPHPLQETDLTGVRLVRELRTRVKDLKGFKKTHKVPVDSNDRAVAFVQKIAATDLSADLDSRFDDFRKHCRFRRTDLSISEPEHGRAMISTPWFDYVTTATLADEDSTAVTWRKQLESFRMACDWNHPGLTLMFMGAFDTVEMEPVTMPALPELIDHFEDSQPADLRIEYDRQATWCRLMMKGVSGMIRISQDCVSLVSTQPASATALLESFVRLRGRLNALDCLKI
jgi:hypothetical protein